WWNQVMLSQKVTITTDSGKEIRGIIGSKQPNVLTPEERKKPMEIKNMFIDIGVSSKEEAEEAGVEVGNMVTQYSEFEVLTNDKYLTAKAFDNRYGCALAVEVLKRLKAEKCTFCFPRIEAGMPTVCSETCTGRMRYLGVL
ncbi:4Fe-4S dicluster domain-containing protein, partial [Staphylococcus aureus]|uniref:4Fe-4S dicluster domain-containing protein n=1 Tax=Staphylococcus aureus TaxID=1280 RepID=UPI00351DD686